jgi:uncharacterized RDD family membrane protein YckC
MEFRSIYTLETADNVMIKVELAGLANRVFAFGIDTLVMGGLMGAVTLLTVILTAMKGAEELGHTLLPLGLLIVFLGYHILQEWLWNGKTIGKTVFSIRVVRNNGQPIGFWEAFGRNLLRVVDVYMSGIGLLVMMCNPSEKRCGDFISGTIVINDQSMPGPTILTGVKPIEAPLATENNVEHPLRISAEEFELFRAFQSRRKQLSAESRQVLAAAFLQYFSQRWHQPVASWEELEDLLTQAARQT